VLTGEELACNTLHAESTTSTILDIRVTAHLGTNSKHGTKLSASFL